MPVFDRPLASLPGVVDSDLAEPAGTLVDRLALVVRMGHHSVSGS